jgi:hypothetical protein
MMHQVIGLCSISDSLKNSTDHDAEAHTGRILMSQFIIIQ